MDPTAPHPSLRRRGAYRLLRLGHRLLVRPVAGIAADVAAAVIGANTTPAQGNPRRTADWWTTTLIASAVSVCIGCMYVSTIWPAAVLWFAIAVVLPGRRFSEGLRMVPYFLLTAVLLSTVPVLGWWLAGAAVLAAGLAAAFAWVRWWRRRRADARRIEPMRAQAVAVAAEDGPPAAE